MGFIAIIYAYLALPDPAFAWAERAYEGRDSAVLLIHIDPSFDSYRKDPRYVNIMRKLDLSPM
jgi:hypothetical protein